MVHEPRPEESRPLLDRLRDELGDLRAELVTTRAELAPVARIARGGTPALRAS